MPGRQFVLSNRYRFGYQGQFAEKDEETGYNHFEARDYDSRIGRWLIPDPAGQYWSPYIAMGNNPVNFVDPDGRYSEFWAGIAKWAFGADAIVRTADADGNLTNNYGIRWLGENGGDRYHGWAPVGFAMGGSTGGSSFGWMQQTTPSAWQQNMYGFTDWYANKVLQGAEAMLMAEGFAEMAAESVAILSEKLAAKTVSKVDDVANLAKSWLEKDAKGKINKAGDYIFISKDGLRKIRLDIKNPYPDLSPHIHLEKFTNGKWRDAIPGMHRIYPKK